MKSQSVFSWTIILLLLYILFTNECGSRNNKETIVQLKETETIYDSTLKVIEVMVPVPHVMEYHYYKDSIITGIVEVDTGAIIKDYFTKYVYNDTISNDSIDIFLEEDVFKNSIIKRNVSYVWKKPLIVNKTYNVYDHNNLYLGLNTTFGSEYVGLSPTILYERKWGALSGGYDLINSNINFGLYKKINLKLNLKNIK